MKKLIAILAIFGLVTGAVFAQADFSAGGATKTTLLSGNSEADDMMTGFESWFWVGAGKTNEDGTAGAKGSISINTTGSSLNSSGDDTWFYAWWQPIEQVFIKMGKVGEDGKYWAGAGIMGWDFQSNDLLISPTFNYYNGFAGSMIGDSHGFFDNGLNNYTALQLSLLPMDGLAINFGWNMTGEKNSDGVTNELVGTLIDNIAVQVVYEIDGAGTAAFGFKNAPEADGIQIAVQYGQPLNDDMKFGVGIRLDMYDDYMAPLAVGLEFGYGSPWGSDFWLNARVGISIGIDSDAKDPMIFGVDVCPSIDMGSFRFYCPVGIAMFIPDEGDSLMAWSLNPYIRKQMGGLEMWVGLMLYNGASFGGAPHLNESEAWYAGVYSKDSADQVNWAIPIALMWAW